jgi:hypothetical protein
MPSHMPHIAVSAECPYMVNGITTVIAPVWQAISPEKNDSDKTTEATPTPRLEDTHGLDAMGKVLGVSVYEVAQEEGFSGARGKTDLPYAPA